MKYIPLGNRVLLDPQHENSKTASGLYIPNAEDKETMVGIVFAISEDIETHAPPLAVGTKVRYDLYSGTDLPTGEKLIDLKDILCIIEDEEDD